MTDQPRLIEAAFPLRQTSIDSVHEKNVRHGHISTLHIYPARRPLAACRAALVATLLPDPQDAEKRKELLEKLGGRVKQTIKRKKQNGKTEETIVEETEGGILHWGRETENKETLDWFRSEIRKAYGGRAPRVLDPFAGGGAIPLEAMRLGCEVTAVDINPVAWLILKCTLEYPQKLAGQKRRLPDFVLHDEGFMRSFFEAHGFSKREVRHRLEKLGLGATSDPMMEGTTIEADADLEADLAWHVRAWGQWILSRARRDLAKFYPTYAEFEPLDKLNADWEEREPVLVPTDVAGLPDVESLNAIFDKAYLVSKKNPRWLAKTTAAYLWARTVQCKNCRATIPLLKTRWLCKKDEKRVVLAMQPNADRTGVEFNVERDVPQASGSAARKREHDKRVGGGTMSRSGAQCPCCPVIMRMEDIRLEGQAGRLGTVMTAVVVDGPDGKEYRLPTDEERQMAEEAREALASVFKEIPFGLPEEPLPSKEALGFRVPLYGFDKWHKLFAPRQILALGTFIRHTRDARLVMSETNYPPEWIEAINAYLAIAIDRVANRASTLCIWNMRAQEIEQTFARFALPILWDYAELNPLSHASGNYADQINWVTLVCKHAVQAMTDGSVASVKAQSATNDSLFNFDVVVTDPPYYDAIPYSDLMDFFYIWLRRTLYGLTKDINNVFNEPLSPKWNYETNDGELIDDASRFGGDRAKSKAVYEDGMFRAFQACHTALNDDGRLVIVFAHKQPDAWETLVSAIIRAGFVVDGSYPIQTERTGRMRANASAALSSSVWLVCKKRHAAARPGWDNRVLEEMQERIRVRLRDFWDAGLRGPDFVWAATGPALEAYSRHPIVKKANAPGELMTVAEFLRHVRRIVVDFVVGRVLSETGGNGEAVTGLDDVTTYYLLHRHDFKMADAPIGACILYAVSCNLSDSALVDQFDILTRTGGASSAAEDAGEGEEADETEDGGETEDTDSVRAEGTGSRVRLKDWKLRKHRQMGFEAPGGRPVPLIDMVHRLMHFWRAGDVVKVNDYLDSRGLRQNNLFHQLLQALIELAPHASEERSLLESISNHVAARGPKPEKKQMELTIG